MADVKDRLSEEGFSQEETDAILNRELSNKMDKKLGVTGENYNWTIRYTFDFSHKNLNETIQKITEYSIYNMLNKNINKEGL